MAAFSSRWNLIYTLLMLLTALDDCLLSKLASLELFLPFIYGYERYLVKLVCPSLAMFQTGGCIHG